jgi:hypothetical protein
MICFNDPAGLCATPAGWRMARRHGPKEPSLELRPLASAALFHPNRPHGILLVGNILVLVVERLKVGGDAGHRGAQSMVCSIIRLDRRGLTQRVRSTATTRRFGGRTYQSWILLVRIVRLPIALRRLFLVVGIVGFLIALVVLLLPARVARVLSRLGDAKVRHGLLGLAIVTLTSQRLRLFEVTDLFARAAVAVVTSYALHAASMVEQGRVWIDSVPLAQSSILPRGHLVREAGLDEQREDEGGY